MLKKKIYNIVFDTNSCSFNEAVSFLVIWLLLQATTQKLVWFTQNHLLLSYAHY